MRPLARSTRQGGSHWPRWLWGLIVALLLGGLLVSLFSALRLRHNSGSLIIRPATATTKISLAQTGSEPRLVGSGPTTIRLQPGVYQITASTDQGATATMVSVATQQTRTVQLQAVPAVPVQKLANYNAQYLFSQADHLYFLNQDDGIPYVYQLGHAAARPYMATLNNLHSLHWLSPTEAIAEKSGGKWVHLKDNQSSPFAFNTSNPNPGSASFGSAGHLAFVAGKKIVAAAGIDQDFQSIGDVSNSQERVSVAPNGNTLVYTPHLGDHDPLGSTRLYENGQFTTLDTNLSGIANVAWNTDSTALSYTTAQGGFVYDLATKRSTQMLVGAPTNPSSGLWVSSHELLYADHGSIWQYDTERRTAHKLATLQGALGAQQPLTLADDGHTVYFSTTAGKDKAGIFRLASNFSSMDSAEQQAIGRQYAQQPKQVQRIIGINQLIKNGLTPDQTQSLKYALGEFASTNHIAAEVVTLKDFQTTLLTSRNSATEVKYRVDFTMLANTKTYRANLDVFDISGIRLQVFDAQHKQLFDSGVLRSQ
jgi:hypothetical protein